MLINNLQKHKEKYGQSKRARSLQNFGDFPSKNFIDPMKKTTSPLGCTRSSSKLPTNNRNTTDQKRLIEMDFQIRTESKVDIYNRYKRQTAAEIEQADLKTLRQLKFFDRENQAGRKGWEEKYKTMKKFKKVQINSKALEMGHNQQEANIKWEQNTASNWRSRKQSAEASQLKKMQCTQGQIPHSIRQTKKSRQKVNRQKTQTVLKKFVYNQHRRNEINQSEELHSAKKPCLSAQNIKDIEEMEKNFVNSIKFHEVFFCCSCLRYIFAIEKKLHYPNCQNKIDCDVLDSDAKHKLGFQRLEVLRELSLYTNTKTQKIAKIIQKIEKEKGSKDLSLLPNRKFLKLQEIENAAAVITWRLFSEKADKNGQNFCNFVGNDTENEIDKHF